MKEQLHIFLTKHLDGGEWSALFSDSILHTEEAKEVNWMKTRKKGEENKTINKQKEVTKKKNRIDKEGKEVS